MRDQTQAFLSGHRHARVEAIAEELVGVIEAENPGYRELGVVTRADLKHSCVANIERVLELLADTDPGGSERPPVEVDPAFDAARETGQRRAEQGMTLDDVLRSFRMGGRLIWGDLLAQAPDGLDPDDVREIGTRLWEVVDHTSAQVAASFHRHERASVRADEQQRAELWEGLLNGRAADASFAHLAARVLDLPVVGGYLVLIAGDLDLGRAEQAAGRHPSRWVRRTDAVVGLVSLRDDDATDVLEVVERLALAAGACVGASSVVAGLGSVGGGFAQAQLALRAHGAEPGLSAFDRRLPDALLLSSPAVSERLVAVWLAPLLDLGGGEGGVLLDTLGAWVETGGSVTRTAARVPCHRNTVVNRLARVEELVGRPLQDHGPPVELDLALRALRMGPWR